MAFPPGVTTATISLGTMFDFRGNAVEKVTAKVEVFLGGNATKLNYRGTGQTVVPSVFTVEAVEGMISFQLPHVDQPGFFAGDGTEATYWAYIISIQATPQGSKAVKWVKRLQPIVGQDSIDLDNVVDGELTSFVSTPQATVTSVNGMTGDVWVSGDGSGGSVDLSEYATKVELDAAIQSVDLSVDTTAIYSRIAEVEATVPDVSTFVSRGELQNYALSEDIPDTSQFIDSAELDAAIQSSGASFDPTAIYTRIDEVESSIPDTSNLATKVELQNYALSEDIPDTSQFIDSTELDAAIQSVDTTAIYTRIDEVEATVPDTSNLATKVELQNYAPSGHTHTELEQRITALEGAPSGGTVTLIESPAGSGLYEIQGA